MYFSASICYDKFRMIFMCKRKLKCASVMVVIHAPVPFLVLVLVSMANNKNYFVINIVSNSNISLKHH